MSAKMRRAPGHLLLKISGVDVTYVTRLGHVHPAPSFATISISRTEAMAFQYQYTPPHEPGDPLAPLFNCLHFLITPAAPVHFFLAQVLPPNTGFSGKEGWSLRIVQRDDASCHYTAVALAYEANGTLPPRDYDVRTVRRAIRATLDRFAQHHPGRKLEVDAAIRRFNLTRDGGHAEPYLLPPSELD